MDFLSILSLLVLFSPYTSGSPQWPCSLKHCPQLVCIEGWAFIGTDMSGRKYSQCRQFTKIGHKLNKVKESVKDIL